VELRYLEESGTKEEAMQKEAAYKKLTRKQKDALILSKKNLLQ
jgi:predicted GIY-YIG superfamily endonuclease